MSGHDMLSPATVLKQALRVPVSFNTNILIVGGGYLGISTLVSLKNHLRRVSREKPKLFERPVSVTLVEPRAGLLNIIGVPRCMVDVEFAKTQFVPFEYLNDLVFDSVILTDEKVAEIGKGNNTPAGFLLNYVHGTVTYLDDKRAQYSVHSLDEKAFIDFDFVVYAAGRDRAWPISPRGHTLPQFLDEMSQFTKSVEQHDTISVIGAGAVGIEVAGDIKFKYPNKSVSLIHPHALFPPEPLQDAFKNLTRESLERAGVQVITNARVEKELSSGDLVLTDGRTIKSQFNYWSNHHHNNTKMISKTLHHYLSTENNIYVNQYLQLERDGITISNFFAIGDLVEMPMIKSAGWAMYMGRQVANNLIHLLTENVFVEPFPDLNTVPKGMVLIAGNEEIVSELSGEIELNNKNYSQEYKDYCLGKVRATLAC